MPSTFIGMRGHIGNSEYVTIHMTFGEVARFITYTDDEASWSSSPLVRTQRELNLKRIQHEMLPYVLNNEDFIFGPLVVELELEDRKQSLPFTPYDAGGDAGILTLNGTETMRCVDGQHRLKTIDQAVKWKTDLVTQTIPVMVFLYRGIEQSQQRFSDLNRNAKKPPKSLSSMFDQRDLVSNITKAIVSLPNSRYYGLGFVSLEKDTPKKESQETITFAVLMDCVKSLLGELPYLPNRSDREKYIKAMALEIISIYDNVVFPTLQKCAPEINLVYSNQEYAYKLRTNYIFAFSIGHRAIALAIAAARARWPEGWQDNVRRGLLAIDWHINHPEWEGIAVSGGIVAHDTQHVRRTAAQIKAFIDPTLLSDEEQNDLLAVKHARSPSLAIEEKSG